MTSYTAQQETTRRELYTTAKAWLPTTTLRLLFLLIFSICGLLYVIETSAVSTTGYEITAIQKQINNLEQENQRLQFDIATHRSMKSIQERLRSLNLVAVADAEYINGSRMTVARR